MSCFLINVSSALCPVFILRPMWAKYFVKRQIRRQLVPFRSRPQKGKSQTISVLRNAVCDFIGLECIKTKEEQVEQQRYNERRFPFTLFYFICTLILSALSQATQSHCRQKIFQTAVMDKT